MKKYIAVAIAVVALTGCIDTGNGEKVGNIVKVATQGVFCKTVEVEIVRGGFSNGNGVNGQAFHFTVENNPNLVEKLREYMDTRQEVKIKYRTEGITFCRTESPNQAFLTNIEVLGKEANRPLEISADEALPVTVVPQEDVETRDAKILKLLKTQQALIEELATKK